MTAPSEKNTSEPAPIGLLIPAYRPTAVLVDLVRRLISNTEIAAVVVIDDGSGPAYQAIFDALRGLPAVEVLSHAVNLGKGAAIKTGLNHLLNRRPVLAGIVTADADGQHAPEDIALIIHALIARPDRLVLGTRSIGKSAPLRSRIGNSAARLTFRFLVGRPLDDTQTGLRGIPRDLIPELLHLPSQRYEFEMDMLLAAVRAGTKIDEIPIRTIYLENNAGSFFNPFFDSVRVYFLLTRFVLASLASTIIDVLAFLAVLALGSTVFGAQVAARCISMPLNFFLVSRYVFHSGAGWLGHLGRFLAWVVVLGAASFYLQLMFRRAAAWSLIEAKFIVESALFAVNFLVQRDFIFTPRRGRD